LSGTGTFLTSYAEGILCDNLSRSGNYIVSRANVNKWYVLYKYEEESSGEYKTIPNFKRVRIIDLDSHCLNCSCGYAQNMLLPCAHICAVIHSMGSECSLDNIHYRWYSHHAYKHDCTQVIDNNIGLIVEPWIKKLKNVELSFDSLFCQITGRYKGCPLSMLQETTLFSHVSPIADIILPDIKLVLDWNWKHGPKVSAPRDESGPQDLAEGTIQLTPEEAVHTKMSEIVATRSKESDDSKVNAWCHLASEMVRPIMRKFLAKAEGLDDLSWLEDTIDQFITSKEMKNTKKCEIDSSMIGSSIAHKRIVRRHRFQGERH
jgi:hypothetical protein